MIDVQYLRSQFPALQHPMDNGTYPIFLDNPAGTQVPQRVIDAVSHYYTFTNANSGGFFTTSQQTDAMVKAARRLAADFLNAPHADEIVFGPNMTTLMFSLTRAIGKTLQAGDEIVLTRMDHDANVNPWLLIAADYGLVVRWVDIREEDCTLDMGSLEGALSERTKVVATVHAANSMGTINPVEQIAEMAHAVGALYVVDGVQSAPHVPIDVQAIGCDFFLCSAYKFFGPHIGVMWGHHELLESLPAYKVRPAKDKAPYRWETGTPSFETIAGTHAALSYLAEIGERYGDTHSYPAFSGTRRHLKQAMQVLGDYERELVSHLIDGLQKLGGVTIAGITDSKQYHLRVPTVACVFEGHTPDAVAEYLAQQGIYVWSGNYYAVEIMERLNRPDGMVRIGLAHYNTHEEIERLLAVLATL
ncbi:MAG: cysteine desulfurase-like protein [Anaerolineales bacterium]|nr:cysteine desulfurase-like protein [Anaerolineales bacterium]